jgi:predicted nucleic-acid-binding Zn-ribbon protein
MSAVSTRCPKCSGEMVQGFTVDTDGSTRKVGTWVEGAPEKTGALLWKGTKVPKDKCIPMGVFRCSACGFLEFYARPEFAAQ